MTLISLLMQMAEELGAAVESQSANLSRLESDYATALHTTAQQLAAAVAHQTDGNTNTNSSNNSINSSSNHSKSNHNSSFLAAVSALTDLFTVQHGVLAAMLEVRHAPFDL